LGGSLDAAAAAGPHGPAMTQIHPFSLALAALLAAAPAGAHAQALGQPRQDCGPEARFESRPLGDGRYLYQFTLANPSRTAALRYSYSFTLPGGTRPAEALNGYLPPGASTEHALGTGATALGAEALRGATTLRCDPM
jgi:hypothetical protein